MDCTTRDSFSLSPSLPSFLSLPVALPLFCLLLAQIPFKAAKGVSVNLLGSKLIVDCTSIVQESHGGFILLQCVFDQTGPCAKTALLLAVSLSLSLLFLKIVVKVFLSFTVFWFQYNLISLLIQNCFTLVTFSVSSCSLLNFSETVYHSCSLWLRQN